jgi:poly(A) polymerase
MTDREDILINQPWMSHPATEAVMTALETAGGVDCARYVGGCVRDAVLGRPATDIDIATKLAPEAVVAALQAAGLNVIPTGLAHGTVTAVTRGRAFEITSLRRDVETDGRHAVVAFTTDWTEDAARRDFRLNALYADRRGRLFDPTGGGLSDARAGAVVFVGDPIARIREDALRIPRYFRFLAWYGRGEPDAAALAACRAESSRLDLLSAERVGQEMMKLMAAADPRAAVRKMAEAGVLRRLIADAVQLARFEALVEIETNVLFHDDPLLRLAALLTGGPESADRTAAALRLPNNKRDRLRAALGFEATLVSWMSPRQTRQMVYRLGPQTFRDRALLAWAASGRPAAGIQWRALLPIAETWTPPTFPLTGDEVAAAGVPYGPMIGTVLREVEAWWIDQDFIDDKLSIMERLKAVAQGMSY